MTIMRAVIRVSGQVQMVGFRWWVTTQAKPLGLVGRAQNMIDGDVIVVAQGPEAAVEELIKRLREQPSKHRRPGIVLETEVAWSEEQPGLTDFIPA